MRAVRGLLGFVLILAIIAMGLYLARLPIASMVVRSAMSGAGLENPEAKVTGLSPAAIQLRDVRVGPDGGEAVDLENVNITYDWRTVLSDRRVKSIKAGPGEIRAVLAPDGTLSLPGISLGGEASDAGLPFDRLSLDGIALFLDAPEGSAQGTLNASYDVTTGGKGALELTTDEAGYQSLRVENGSGLLTADLQDDGVIKITGAFKGNIYSELGPVRNLDLAFDGTGASWRDAAAGHRDALAGDATIELRSAALSPDESELLSAVNIGDGVYLFGRRVASINIDGTLLASYARGKTEFVIPEDNALAAKTDTGATLAITPLEGKPLLAIDGEQKMVAFDHTITGALLTAIGSFEAEQSGGAWSFRAPAQIGEYRSEAIKVANSTVLVDGATTVSGVTADVSLTTALEELSVGRFDVFDAPVEATVNVAVDNTAHTITVSPKDDTCLNVKSARFAIVEQNTKAQLSNGRLCETDAPLAVVNWGGALQCTLHGKLTASNARYSLGKTNVRGRPPEINFDAIYEPAQNTTRMRGMLDGGSMVLNDALRVSSADGEFELTLDQETMKGALDVSQSTIATTQDPPGVAPLIAASEMDLVDSDLAFSFSLSTPTAHRLGEGRGTHNMESARGEASFDFERLEFQPGRLQPEKLAPLLRGIIGRSSGAVAGTANFTWAPEPIGVGSTAGFSFENLTFQGPGITVTETVGVNGDVNLASLWPLQTDGVQTISIGRIDLAALQLENGTVNFEMPGDETLRVSEATFPWFGGLLGVYGVNAAMSGGEAVARLEAKDADLAQILDYVDVDGLSGEAILSGVLPLVIEEGKARIEGGVLSSNGPGVIRYTGSASDAASSAGEEAEIAFGILRNLQFNSLIVNIDGPLDGTIDFNMVFEGVGDVPVNRQNVTVPVIYRINLEAALLDLLNQVNISRNIEMQIEQALEESGANN